MLKQLFCIIFIVGSLGDQFSISNPDGLIIDIKDQNDSPYYSSENSENHEYPDNVVVTKGSASDVVGFTPETNYVTITAKTGYGEEVFSKEFATSLNHPWKQWSSNRVYDIVCDYDIMITRRKGYRHQKSSLSSSVCTEDQDFTWSDTKSLKAVNRALKEALKAALN